MEGMQRTSDKIMDINITKVKRHNTQNIDKEN